jgi:phosphatidylserine decarboxylase
LLLFTRFQSAAAATGSAADQNNQNETRDRRRRHHRGAQWARRAVALTVGSACVLTAVLYAGTKTHEAWLAWSIARHLPLNAMSRLTGSLAALTVPPWLRRPLFSAFAYVYGADLAEADRPVEQYASFQEFFTRRLKPNVRSVVATGMASPVDGTVLHFGVVGSDGSLEQVKGSPFTLDSFIGPHELAHATTAAAGKQLYFCTIYLAPGDYHGVHAPVAMTVDGRRHFPGLLMPVSPVVVSLMQSLFSVNERIVLFGRWHHGFMSVTPVGATNVGSIALTLEPDLRTNAGALRQTFYDRMYDDDKFGAKRHVRAGDELAFFQLGSTVVLVFEAPPFQFAVEHGQKVKLGQMIGFTHSAPEVLRSK